jgi:hypothetical protein
MGGSGAKNPIQLDVKNLLIIVQYSWALSINRTLYIYDITCSTVQQTRVCEGYVFVRWGQMNSLESRPCSTFPFPFGGFGTRDA